MDEWEARFNWVGTNPWNLGENIREEYGKYALFSILIPSGCGLVRLIIISKALIGE